MPRSRLSSFSAKLFRKGAYGYDVSGEVSDDKQLNIRDLFYQGVQPNPQEHAVEPLTNEEKTDQTVKKVQ